MPQIMATLGTMVQDRVNELKPILREEIRAELTPKLKKEIKDEISGDIETKFTDEKNLINSKVEELNQTIQTEVEKTNELGKLHFVRNCQDLYDQGVQTSGSFYADPDGHSSGQPPIPIYCNGEDNTTEITHDFEETMELGRCNEEPGCNAYQVNYGSSMDQVHQLIEQSESCYQTIRFDCHLAPLNQYEQSLGWWLDRTGQPRYFANENGLNCDANEVSWKSDEIEITDKDILPVTGFQYGPLETALDGKKAKLTISRLKCSGDNHPFKLEPKLVQIEDSLDDLTSKIINYTLSVKQSFQNEGERLDLNIEAVDNINSRIDIVEDEANELDDSVKRDGRCL